jgi:hypothetical protein
MIVLRLSAMNSEIIGAGKAETLDSRKNTVMDFIK